jgi:hypothetical protein
MSQTTIKDITSTIDLRPHYGSEQTFCGSGKTPHLDQEFDSDYSSDEDKPWYEKIKYTGNLTEDEHIEEEAIQDQIEISNKYFEMVRNGEIDPFDYIDLSDPIEDYESDSDSDYIPSEDYDNYDNWNGQDWSEYDDDYYEPLFDDDGNEIIEEEFYDDDEETRYYTKPSRQWGYM